MQTWQLHFAGNDQPVELAPVNGEAKLLRTAPEALRREVIRRYGPFATSKRVRGRDGQGVAPNQLACRPEAASLDPTLSDSTKLRHHPAARGEL